MVEILRMLPGLMTFIILYKDEELLDIDSSDRTRAEELEEKCVDPESSTARTSTRYVLAQDDAALEYLEDGEGFVLDSRGMVGEVGCKPDDKVWRKLEV